MVGILLSYWGGLFSGATLVSGRVINLKCLEEVKNGAAGIGDQNDGHLHTYTTLNTGMPPCILKISIL